MDKVDDATLGAGLKDANNCSTEDAERKAVRKLDLTIIPILSMFYLLSFLDRSNLGNARVSGLQNSLGISDHEYSVALTASEIPSNLVLKKIGPNVFLPTIVTLWGLITILQGFVKNYHGLLAARFFLGLVEGGMFPFYLFHFAFRRELQLRIALFFSAASLSGAFSGLLAYLLIKLDGAGDLPGWAWIFIVEGIITCICGIISFFIFPASPETSKFLTSDQKALLMQRLARDRCNNTMQGEKFSWGEVNKAGKSVHVWINSLTIFMSGTNLYSLAYFQPSSKMSFGQSYLIKNVSPFPKLGYSESHTQLLSVPPFAVAFIVMLFTSYISDRYRARGFIACSCAFLGMIGFAIFCGAGVDQKSLKYFSLFLSVPGIYSAAPPLFAWQANNSEGHYRRATAIALSSITGNCGGILSTWLFPRSDSPRYHTGTIVNLIFSIGIIFFAVANRTWLMALNNRKTKNREKLLSKYENDQTKNSTEKSDQAWKELGDKHPDFVYAY
ncbi:major facilitator superfamily domain-containing protein [Phakopsora pachyrhizi]|uniref:Major facilitator superfamily domain-containing protein n=1 Tax=Phakopsora pachyrhizi TaxID=170000 RepID=A0AAV0B8M7_PHAPC|nr:major facilitator superfamily domain-containing protein [Phakopsora pachyrhizi]